MKNLKCHLLSPRLTPAQKQTLLQGQQLWDSPSYFCSYLLRPKACRLSIKKPKGTAEHSARDKTTSTSSLQVYFSRPRTLTDKTLPFKYLLRTLKALGRAVLRGFLWADSKSQVIANSHVRNFYQGNFAGSA